MESRMRIEKSVGTKMNELDLCLKGVRIKVMSTIASHSPLNISETVRNRILVPTSKGRPIGNGLWRMKWLRDR